MHRPLITLLLAALPLMGFSQTLRLAYDADPVSLDPYEQLSGGTLQLSHLTFDPLLRWDKKLQFQARLATDWQRLSPTAMRFTLRQGVRFHSGRQMDADDVIFSFNRLKSSADFRGIFAKVAEIKKRDAHTIDVHTYTPYPLLLNIMTYLFVMDSEFYTGRDKNGLSKRQVIKHGDSFASRNVSGTGPFKLVSREQGVRLSLARHPHYWDSESPGNVMGIELTPIKEAPTRVAALLSGDVDLISPVPPADLERIGRTAELSLVTMVGTRIITFQLNQQSQPAFAKTKVRLAVAQAINQQGIVAKIMKGFAKPAGQLSPDGYLGHRDDLTPRYNLAKARQLMKEAGYPNGFDVTMIAPNNRYVYDSKIAQAVVAMLAKINIRVSLRTFPKAQYWQAFDRGAGDIMMLGWRSDTVDSGNFFQFLLACKDPDKGMGQYNGGGYCNRELDALLLRSSHETDVALRRQLLRQMELLAYREAAIIPLHWQDLSWAARKQVKIDEVVNPMNTPYLGDLVIELEP